MVAVSLGHLNMGCTSANGNHRDVMSDFWCAGYLSYVSTLPEYRDVWPQY